MTYSQKYTLVAFLVPVHVGDEFDMKDWPLHITIADVFSISLNIEIRQQLEELFGKHQPFNLSIGDEAMLGKKRVDLVNKTRMLDEIHSQTVDLLELNKAKFNNPEFVRKGFLPHVTAGALKRSGEGDQINITYVSLVDMFPNNNWMSRKIIQNFKLRVD